VSEHREKKVRNGSVIEEIIFDAAKFLRRGYTEPNLNQQKAQKHEKD
jgi:hypothetical protein